MGARSFGGEAMAPHTPIPHYNWLANSDKTTFADERGQTHRDGANIQARALLFFTSASRVPASG
jgi:hypothetical protein